MPIKPQPQFKAVPDKMLEIPQPAIGGLNLKDLEFEQEVNQSPYMKNVMYRNGAFSKRYGQEVHSSYSDTIYASAYFGGAIFVHSGTKIYRHTTGTPTEIGSGFPEASGIFIVFLQKLYYMCSSGFYYYDPSGNGSFPEIDAYVPDYVINCAPDGLSGGDVIDDINIMGDCLNFIYNGEENVTEYKVEPYDPDELIDWTKTPSPVKKITVNGETETHFTVDTTNKKITFDSAPGDGDMNVVMTFYVKTSKYATARAETLSCKYYDTYGGTYNSRVFLAGDGKSRYYWCYSYDITYWPALNFARLGNTEDDITGFGRQYNVLIAFKPRETYQIVSYIENSSSTIISEDVGTEYFRSLLVNPIIGCDAPHSIQVINNLLTWFSSYMGVCTLVSTNIQDERNIRVISRNIERMNNFGINGILDNGENPLNVVSADFEKKYFLIFPTNGIAYVWDYEISPYFYSSANGETPPSRLSWFYFDKFYAKSMLAAGKTLLYISNLNGTVTRVITAMPSWGMTSDEHYIHVYSDHYEIDCEMQLINTERYVQEGHVYAVVADVKNTLDVNLNFYYNDTSTTIEPSDSYVRASLIFTGESSGKVWMEPAEPTSLTRYWTKKGPVCYDLTEAFGDNALARAEEFVEALPETIDDGESASVEMTVDFRDKLIKLNSSFNDLDFNIDGEPDPIDSFYLTPFMQFGAVEMLKNVKNLYIQCRGDTNSLINISYYTDDSTEAEPDPEPIEVSGGSDFWQDFSWTNFVWFMNIWGNTFRRKCNLKKLQMCAVYFDNNEAGTDMSITHIGMQYQLVKYVR